MEAGRELPPAGGGGLPVVLGFAEAPEARGALAAGRFPSKMGGAPAWLDPAGLPGGAAACACAACGRPGLRFLLQLYCPLDGPGRARCFHRALFLFVCPWCLARPARAGPDGEGAPPTPRAPAGAFARGVRVFRSQLPRVNAHYPPDPLPPLAVEEVPPEPAPAAEGEWVELELVNEEEPGEEDTVRHGPEEARVQAMIEEHRRREAEAEAAGSSGEEEGMAADGGAGAAGGGDDDMEEEETEAEREQDCWDSFRERVGRAPDQAVRYDYGGREGPLWPSLEGRPESVPACPRCGCPRDFEFQVMPQCLLHLGQDELAPDALDWDSILVYTCRDSCGPEDGGGGYVEEFAWVHRNAAGVVRANKG